jgi:hypothetical protein
MSFVRTFSSIALALGLAALVPLSRPLTSPPVNESAKRKLTKVAQGKKLGRSPYVIKDSMKFWTDKRRNARGELPVERYIAARERISEMRGGSRGGQLPTKLQLTVKRQGLSPTAARFAGLAGGRAPFVEPWVDQGPSNIGGRTRALVVQPGGVLYAGGITGGIWKSTNDGATWTRLSDFLSNLSVATLAADPLNPNTLYAGTGEIFSQFRGAGIFKTTDGGVTWSQLPNTANGNFFFVQKVIASPNTAGRVYAATATGVWRSNDGGGTWTRQQTGGFFEIAVLNNAGTDNVFAWQAVDAALADSGVVFRSLDGGGTFAASSNGIPGGHSRGSLTIPAANRAYCAVAAQDDTFVGFFESTDNGVNWTQKALLDNSPTGKLNALLFTNAIFGADIDNNSVGDCPGFPLTVFSQGRYDNVIASHPSNPNRIWLGGIDLWRSDDRGVTWGLASYWWLADTTSPRYLHADHHAIEFHPSYNDTSNTTVYFGNDGGLGRTTNGTAAVGLIASTPSVICNPFPLPAVSFERINNGYGVTQFYHGSVSASGNTLFGGTQDNGTLRAPASGTSWSVIASGDGGFTAIDQTNEQVLYAEQFLLSFFKSTDGGANFVSAQNGITEAAANFSFIAPFAMDPTNSQRLWIGGRQVFRTTDGAANWSAVSPANLTNNSITAWGIPPSGGGNVVYLAAFDQVFRSSDALAATPTWTSIGGGLPAGARISAIGVHPTDAARVFVSYSNFDVTGGQLYATSDGTGAAPTWTASVGTAPNAIPNIPVHDVLVLPNDPSVVLVGTDSGVLGSGDGGGSWATLNANSLPNTIVEYLAFRAPDQLYAFTHGRGVFKTAIEPALVTLVQPNGGDRLRPGGPSTIAWSVNASQPSFGSITSFKIQRSLNNGATFQDVATVPTSDRSFVWTPTSADRTATGRIKIIAQGAGNSVLDEDDSDTAFSVNSLPVARTRDIRGKFGATVPLGAEESTDADGDALSFRWTQVSGTPVTFDASSPNPAISLAGVQAGATLLFNVTASDAAETSLPATGKLTVNRPPTAEPAATIAATGGAVAAHQLTATDPDGDPITVAWKQTSGASVSFDATSPQLSFTAPAAGGTFTFQPDVSDGLDTTAGGVITFAVRATGAAAANSGGGGGGGCRAGTGDDDRAGDVTLLLLLAYIVAGRMLRVRSRCAPASRPGARCS